MNVTEEIFKTRQDNCMNSREMVFAYPIVQESVLREVVLSASWNIMLENNNNILFYCELVVLNISIKLITC